MNKFLILFVFTFFLFGNVAFATQSISSDLKMCTKFTKSLKYRDGYNGKNRPFVRELQKTLIENGYLNDGTADGFYGRKTERALKSYQRTNSLTDTGVLDSDSMLKLRSQFCSAGVAMCDYPAPPAGCNYVPGPQYDQASQCGMMLSCSDQDSPSCKVWNDGCNICSRTEVGGQQMCTMRACYQFRQGTAYCQEYF